jgi:DNA-binding response OmpR family regulator
MEKKPILLVDDERNIRLTVSQSLESLGLPIKSAVNGEEALQMLQEEEFALLLLDLKLPGIDGMEVLHRVRERWPKTRVIIITAHGTIESAVEAMKLGAVDFMQKPFSPRDIRDLVTRVLERETLEEEGASDYPTLIEISKRYINDRRFDDARHMTQNAIAADPQKPEAYNLVGALLEIKGEALEAQKFYRAALDIDPTYKPARANLERTASWHMVGKIELGPEEEESESREKGGNGSKDER